VIITNFIVTVDTIFTDTLYTSCGCIIDKIIKRNDFKERKILL